MRTKLALLLLAAPLAAGCATLFAPGPDWVPVYSDPPGATVRVDGVEAGRTPCHVAVPRRNKGDLTFELAGYEPVTVSRAKVCNGLTALNLLGGLYTMPLFFLIDIATENVVKHSTKPVHVKLVPRPVPPPPVPTPIGRRAGPREGG